MKALVIGATGIIGNHVVRALLHEGIEVRALSRGVTPSINLEGLSVEKVQGDLNQAKDLEKAINGCQWVFHTAPYYPTNAFEIQNHIVRAMKGMKSVLGAVSNSSIDRFVYTSSLTTIGSPHYFGELADETCEYDMIENPPHPYFALKYLMEEEVKKAAHAGLPAVIVNPTGCFGPYELKPPSLCLVPQLIGRKLPAYVNRPINLVDAADVGRGHLLAAQKGTIGERYILGGHNVTSEYLIKRICELGKVAPPRLKMPLKLALIPAWTTEIIGHFFLHKPPLIPVLGLKFIQFGQHISTVRAEKELGFRPSPLDPCFEKAIEWFKSIRYC